jgi:thiamine transporter
VLGGANFVAKFFKNRLLGYGVGAFAVCFARFVCGFISGVAVWNSWIAWEAFDNIWLYSLAYNASYMIPNAIITSLLIVALCAAIDPKTLKRYVKK